MSTSMKKIELINISGKEILIKGDKNDILFHVGERKEFNNLDLLSFEKGILFCPIQGIKVSKIYFNDGRISVFCPERVNSRLEILDIED